MAMISVARALTKLKTLELRITKAITHIETYGGTHTKTLSPLSNSKDLATNQKDAAKIIASDVQAINDLIKYYRQVKQAVNKSNTETYIDTGDYFGKITVADALVLSRDINTIFVNYDSALTRVIAAATKAATNYNSKNLTANITNSTPPEDLQKLQAQPLFLVDASVPERISNISLFLMSELNPLINESNAITMVEVDDGFVNLDKII
jgi:hypothetical protein